MSGFYNDSDDLNDLDREDRQAGGGGLRKLLEDALAQNKKLVERLEKQERGKSTADLLSEKGLDPAIAELIPADIDPAQWVEKYAHLLGVAVNEDTTPIAPETQVADDSDPAVQLALHAEQQALAAMQDAAESGFPAALQSDIDEMNKMQTEQELLAFFNSKATPLGG